MSKLIESFQKLKDKFLSLGKGIRIITALLLVAVVISMISVFFVSSNNYKILFSGLEPADAQMVQQKLKEQKVDTKIKGDAILVPKDLVDELRLALAPEITSGSKGYELLDSGNSFGMSEDEFNIKKLRMQQGELEKTIKSFPQVENARVHITPAKDSVFVENKEPGKASVYLKLANGSKMSQEQVSSIMALVSGAVENLPKENIEVIDNNMNLLSKNVGTENGINSSDSVENQQVLQKKFESELQQRVQELLEPIFGKGKVNVAVNADLDFDSKQSTQITIDPNNVVISEDILKESTSTNGDSTSNSAVDNNMGTTIDENGNLVTSSKEQEIKNYETGKTENVIISAPGQIRRLTASVAIDGDLDDGTQRSIENLVSTAIGLNKDRNDEINVVGMTFGKIENTDTVFNEMDNNTKTKNILIYCGIFLISIMIIGLVIFFIKKKNQDEYDDDEIGEINSLEDIQTTNKIDLLENTEVDPKVLLEEELKTYAQDKPSQVVDILKSWLSEDER